MFAKALIGKVIMLATVMTALLLLGVPTAQADPPHFQDEIDAIGSFPALGLIGEVNDAPLSPGQKKSLIRKLEAAIKHLEKDRERGACGKLKDFIAQVDGFINSGILTTTEGDPLIDSATAIRDAICP